MTFNQANKSIKNALIEEPYDITLPLAEFKIKTARDLCYSCVQNVDCMARIWMFSPIIQCNFYKQNLRVEDSKKVREETT